MDHQTHKYYTDHARDAVNTYQLCGESGIAEHFADAFTPGSRVLEIGAGSGRDLHLLLTRGYEAYGIDASSGMRDAAIQAYPDVAERYAVNTIPSEEPYRGGPFDGILCSAMLMHVADSELLDAAYTFRKNLRSGGTLLLSAPLTRSDLDESGRTPDGRLFNIRTPEYYELLL